MTVTTISRVSAERRRRGALDGAGEDGGARRWWRWGMSTRRGTECGGGGWRAAGKTKEARDRARAQSMEDEDCK